MFTGIIERLGRIRRMETHGQALRMAVECGFEDVILGESIALNGVCLTVVGMEDSCLAFDVSPETLARSSLGHRQPGDRVNVERAMLPSTRFGGHIVSGHVDTMATIHALQPRDDFHEVVFRLPGTYLRYIAEKGSVAVDGCSLTVNAVSGEGFSVMIIPHTWENTVFRYYRPGDPVNIEVDMLARYVERLLSVQADPDGGAQEADPDSRILLANHPDTDKHV